uniref:Uncharacterized protein n=1 Tax=Plectus sambesii TaxID=2011161 RepID=A0A914XS41_9BILA
MGRDATVFRISLLLVTTFAVAIGRKEYADPIEWPAKQNTPFVFDMNIEWTLTMSYPIEYNLVNTIDYFPDELSTPNCSLQGDRLCAWFIRNNDQLMACNLKDPLPDISLLNEVVQMHGLHQRVITINGVSPANTMVVPLGAEVIMRVHNNLLMEGISVHLHGMDKTNLWYTDGVGLVQQCPIPIRSTYAYRFIADTPGTLWWHGHVGTDRGEGLLGAFIVAKDDESVVDSTGTKVLPSRQYVALLQDWPEVDSHAVWYNQKWKIMKFLYGYDNWKQCWAPTRTYDGTNVGGSVPLNGLLVNDKGWYNQNDVITRPWALPLEKFKIKAGEKIVIRLINGGTAQQMMVGFEGHSMTIVAADGVPVQPRVVDYVVLFSGERYDVLIEGKANPDRQTYYMTIETQEYYDWHWNWMPPYFGLAKLEYEGNWPVVTSVADIWHSHCSTAAPCSVLNCPFGQYPTSVPLTCVSVGDLKSLQPISDPATISDQGFTNGGFEEYFINMHFDSHVNGWKFAQPKGMPYYYNGRENDVMQWCDPSKCPNNASEYDSGCDCFIHYNLTLGNVVQFTIYNMGYGAEPGHGYAHPLHIHGTHFYLLKVGYPTYDPKGMEYQHNPDIPCVQQTNISQCNNLQWTNPSWMNGRIEGMNTKDPSSRDTVVVPVGGYIVIRFKAVNPGWFYAHCHVMMHHMGGTAFALRVGQHEQMPVPPPNFPSSCGIYEPPALNSPNNTTNPTQPTTTTSSGLNVSPLPSVFLLVVTLLMTHILFNH